MNIPNKCTAKNRNGAPCKMPPLRGQSLCWAHAQGHDVARRRRAAAQAGGQQRGIQLARQAGGGACASLDPPPGWWSLETANDAAGAFAWAAQRLASGELDSRTATSMATLLNGLVATLREGEVEQRIELLEAALGPRRVG